MSSPFGQNFLYPAAGGEEGVVQVPTTSVSNADHHTTVTVPLSMPTVSHANPHTQQQQQSHQPQQHSTHSQQSHQQAHQVEISHGSDYTNVTTTTTAAAAQHNLHSAGLEASSNGASQPISS